MLQLKIQGGTPKSGKALCHTCKHSTIVRGQNCEEIIFCNHLSFRDNVVPFRVAECRDYHPSTMPWLHEMQAIAWNIEARKRGPVGFEPGDPEMEIVITPPKKDEGSNGSTPCQ